MHYTTDALRTKWLEFYQSKDHVIIPSARVVPENDPTALFINSGMHPLVPYLMGEHHPHGVRLANVQKCVRTGDIEEVGDKTHLTFFEMMGNWSLGDYFKEKQIPWSFEFLTSKKWLNLPLERLAFTVFEGDDNAPRDTESFELWKSVGVPESKIAFLDAEENWWAKGEFGPCGPDSEMFYWTGDLDDPALQKPYQETWEDPHWVEIWNDVFMQFEKKESGELVELPAQNIDTGMGLERTVAVLNGMTSVYQTDAFTDILAKIAGLCCPKDPEKARTHCIVADPVGDSPEQASARVIADHLRSGTVMVADGVTPSNVDQGYILRRLLRRAIRHGRKLGIEGELCAPVAGAVIGKLGKAYPELESQKVLILEVLGAEEMQFKKTLESGEKQFRKLVDTGVKEIDSVTAFDLYQTYGFPIEITEELAEEAGLKIDTKGFQKEYEAHQDLSRAGAEQRFAGGLAGGSEQEAKLHTATHLMHAGLRKVLGPQVEQRGSNITPERLRFDFNWDEKMTPEQIAAVEQYVNDAIATDVPISCTETTVEEAKNEGAIGLFEGKYGDKVKMYQMGDFSKEICGGPHAARTGDLGSFKIKKEQSSSAGVRRIKAVLTES